MNIEFEDKALDELYATGHTSDKSYNRLPKDIIKKYIRVVNYMRSARRIEDLYTINSLHYERKKGKMKDIEAVWINDQYRLLFKSSSDDTDIIVNALLTEISKHYE